MSFELLHKGNSKLGRDVWTFSLPPIKTCPGRGECEKFCYAVSMTARYSSVEQSWQHALEATKSDGWEEKVIEQIVKKQIKTVRVHVGGDFYSVAYIRSWTQIARALPDVRFFAYTRSWCVSRLEKDLNSLRTEPNVSLYASVEPQEWDDARIQAWNKASVIEGFEKDKSHPGIVCPEAMWRHKTDSTRKAVPVGAVSCSSCRYCIVGKGNIQFPLH